MCYHKKEVIILDNEQHEQDIPEQTGYTPRPRWQVLLARIGLIIFTAFLLMYYVNLFRGGM